MVFNFLRKKSYGERLAEEKFINPSKRFSKRKKVSSQLKKLKAQKKLEQDIGKIQRLRGRKTRAIGHELGRSVQEFGRVGLRQPEPFTQEQEILNDMFGGGSQIWGTEREPVKINHALMRRQFDPDEDETASLFGIR